MSEVMDGSFSETGEHRRQVFAHGDVHPSAGFDDREDGGDFGSGLLAADVDPVLPSWYEMALYHTALLEWFHQYLGETRHPGPRNNSCAVFDPATGQRFK
jgi:hypothetical protein